MEPLVFSERFDVPTQTWSVDRVARQGDRRVLKPWVTIGPSTVPNAGDGVFAARHFRKGETVGFYAGEICSSNDRDDSLYLLMLDELDPTEDTVIDAEQGGNWTRMLNDGSPRCNARWRKSRCNVQFANHNKIVAIQSIKVGQELFIDYGSDYWDGVPSGTEAGA